MSLTKKRSNIIMTEPKTYKEFIRWLEVFSPVNWEETERFEDEAGTNMDYLI